ncbi:MAG TPA: serine/threonine-protein kinase [Polyangiaceae bacterium]
MSTPSSTPHVRTLGRYALHDPIASGGMATVHLGQLVGAAGFSRTVAIKRLHAHFAQDPQFVMMFMDEARVAGRIRHPNVVPTLDVVSAEGELFLVMEYVEGESLVRLLKVAARRHQPVPLPVAGSIVAGLLHGLHAAHEARDENGEPLGIVHRDVSPHNVLVGRDGVARVVDFGVAKAAGRLQTTREGQLKGKLLYMAPELFRGSAPERRVDVYGAAVVLWETLVGRRLFAGQTDAETVGKILANSVRRPGELREGIPPALDDVVLRGLIGDPAERFATALEMATALEAACPVAPAAAVGAWVDDAVAEVLTERAIKIAAMERGSESGRARAISAASLEPAPGAEAAPSPETVTSLSVTSKPGDGRSRWRATKVVVIGAVAGVVAASAVLTIASTRRGSHEHPTPATPSVTASSPASAPPTAVVPPVVSASPTGEPSSTGSGSQDTSAASVPRGGLPAPTGVARPPRKPPPVRFQQPD